jgi:hypothetical protein
MKSASYQKGCSKEKQDVNTAIGLSLAMIKNKVNESS